MIQSERATDSLRPAWRSFFSKPDLPTRDIKTSTSSSATFMQAEVTAHQLEELRPSSRVPPQPLSSSTRTAVCQLPQVGCALIFPSLLHSTADSACQETVSQIVALSSLLLSVPGRPKPIDPI
jgi:hypothetical protein